MCSVAGMLALRGRLAPSPAAVQRMSRALRHRGPDGEGERVDDACHLAMNRLAIVGGPVVEVPFRNETADVWVAFNGEIYNHRELRAALGRGHALRSASDGDLLSHLYEEDGLAFVERLRGIFAFALWDARRSRLVLGRDRLGVKPLFYARTGDRQTLLFASECKGILASGMIDRALDPVGIDHYFVYSYPVPPRTMFAGISALPPAHLGIVERGELTLRRYWDVTFPRTSEQERRPHAAWTNEFRALLEAAVREQIPDEVPFGAYLSGGIDSSVTAALAVRERGPTVPTLSCGFSDPLHDESAYFRAMAGHLGTTNYEVVCNDDSATDYPDALWHLETPSWFPICIPSLRLGRLAAERGLKVVLSGEGADEILGGYDVFRADKIRRAFDFPVLRRLRPALYARLYGWAGAPAGIAEHMERMHRDAADVVARYGFYPPWYDYWHLLPDFASVIYGPRLHEDLTSLSDAGWAVGRTAIDGRAPLNQGLYAEYQTRLPGFILTVGDRASMASGVELRVPFLDHRLVEFCARVPPAQKLRGFTTKAILRATTKDLLPPAINARPKKPFFTPVGPWFFEDRRPAYVRELLGAAALEETGYFHADRVALLESALRVAPQNSLRRLMFEWLLLGVLSVQVLDALFVRGVEPASLGELERESA